VGDYDYVGMALRDAGLALHFNKVAAKPGRPMTFASKPGRAVFGLPGNPVSVFLMFHLFVLRAAAALSGGTWLRREIRLPLSRAFRRRRVERVEYVPCRVTDDGMLEAIEFHGSAHLTALMAADGFFVVPKGQPTLAVGDRVGFVSIRAV
jgi:molybdopterin molybdotransferase